MSTTDYRNQVALNKALNIYRTYMRSFIIFHSKKIPWTNVEDAVINSVSEWRADEIERSLADRDIKSIIDVKVTEDQVKRNPSAKLVSHTANSPRNLNSHLQEFRILH